MRKMYDHCHIIMFYAGSFCLNWVQQRPDEHLWMFSFSEVWVKNAQKYCSLWACLAFDTCIFPSRVIILIMMLSRRQPFRFYVTALWSSHKVSYFFRIPQNFLLYPCQPCLRISTRVQTSEYDDSFELKRNLSLFSCLHLFCETFFLLRLTFSRTFMNSTIAIFPQFIISSIWLWCRERAPPVGGRVGYDFYYVGHRAFCFSNLFNLLLLPLSAVPRKRLRL